MNTHEHKAIGILDHPEVVRKGVFSTQALEKILGWPRAELNPMLFRLVRKGNLVRIKRGLFCVRPLGVQDSPKSYPYSWYLIARALMDPKPYFISYYSAMQLHGMTTASVQTIFVSRQEQARLPEGLRIPVRFVTIPKKRFWGLEEKWVTNEEKVWMSDLEHTLLDALDRLDLSGGMMEIARGLWLVKDKMNLVKLLHDAKRFGSAAVAKRLGFLMEILLLGREKEREELRNFALTRRSYVLLDPTLKKRGHYLHSWRLLVNIDPDEIKENVMT